MIDQILQTVQQEIGQKLANHTGIDQTKVPSALETVSASIMGKAKQFMEQGKILELKDLFTGEDSEEKERFMKDMKINVSKELQEGEDISYDQAESFVDMSVPEIIRVSKEKLLGPDGKVGLADLPKLMSFFKSEGKDVSSTGGLGGLFGL